MNNTHQYYQFIYSAYVCLYSNTRLKRSKLCYPVISCYNTNAFAANQSRAVQ